MKKKVVSLMLVLAMTVSMTACGNRTMPQMMQMLSKTQKPVQNQAAAKKQ